MPIPQLAIFPVPCHARLEIPKPVASAPLNSANPAISNFVGQEELREPVPAHPHIVLTGCVGCRSAGL